MLTDSITPAGSRLRAGTSALLLFLAACPAFGADKPLRYLSAAKLDSAAILAPPPAHGSAEQIADLGEVVAVHRMCSSNELDLAFSEKKFSITNFAFAIGPDFQPGRFPKTSAFIERVRSEAAAATDVAKEFWKRPRPYTVDPTLAAGKLETSFSYPSGHSTEATAMGLVLADLFPGRREQILGVSRDIGWHRVWIARHYPTDIYAGRVYALAIVREMKANADFQRDFAEAQSELAAALQTTDKAVESETTTAARR